MFQIFVIESDILMELLCAVFHIVDLCYTSLWNQCLTLMWFQTNITHPSNTGRLVFHVRYLQFLSGFFLLFIARVNSAPGK